MLFLRTGISLLASGTPAETGTTFLGIELEEPFLGIENELDELDFFLGIVNDILAELEGEGEGLRSYKQEVV